MRYRRLRKDELEPLKEAFLKYLLLANITHDIWEELKKSSPSSCDQHLDIFSDLVYEKILNEVNFIDRILPKRLELYHFFKNSVLVYILTPKESASFNFKEENLANLNLNEIELVEGKKEYQLERNIEIFQIIEKEEAKISQGSMFKTIALKIAEQKDCTSDK